MKKLVLLSMMAIFGLSANVASANTVNNGEAMMEASFYAPGKKMKNKRKSPKRRIRQAGKRKYPCKYQG